jgi:hypothetical protein
MEFSLPLNKMSNSAESVKQGGTRKGGVREEEGRGVLEVLLRVWRRFWQISSMKVAIIRTLARSLRARVMMMEERKGAEGERHSDLAMKVQLLTI